MKKSVKNSIKNFCNLHLFKDPSDIYIICSKEPELPANASVYSPEYQYVNNFADKDLLLYVYGFLSKIYSNAKIYIKYPYEYKFESNAGRRFMQDNLVLIGGPATNSILRKVLYDENCPITKYTKVIFPPSTEKERENEDIRACCNCPHFKDGTGKIVCERSKNFCKIEEIKQIDNRVFALKGNPIYTNKFETYSSDNLLIEDYGMFAALENFYSTSHRIVIISGSHSLGALGAFKSYVPLDNSVASQRTIDNNYSKVNEYKNFASFHKTTILRESEYSLNINSEIAAIYPLEKTIEKTNETNNISPLLSELKNNVEELIEAINVFLKDTTHLKSNNEINKAGLIHKLTEALSQIQALFLNYSEDTFKSIKATYQDCLTQFETISEQ